VTTYTILLFLHNLARWAVLGMAAFALFRAATGLLAKGGWLPADEKARKFFPVSLDIQVTLGVVLSFVSPITTSAWSNMAAAMGDKTLRYYAVEHGFVALAALALAHIGGAKVRRLKDARTKFKVMLAFYAPAVVLLVARLPWDRPFFRVP
jgi:hypothetical protein